MEQSDLVPMTVNGELLPAIAPSPMAQAGQAANQAAQDRIFADYHARKAPQTLRRKKADLLLFWEYLEAAGIPTGDLMHDPQEWAGMTWGLVAGFVEWQLQQGYAINSINARLATVKTYCQLALRAGVLDHAAHAQIRTVTGYRGKEGRNVDQTRAKTRQGPKKALPTEFSGKEAAALKQQPDTPQGRRDAVLMCLLLDHGLRCGEVAGLRVEHVNLPAGTFTFYREKVDLVQTHKLTLDTYRALVAYLTLDAPPATGPLLLGSRKDGTLAGRMSTRAINKRVSVLGKGVGIATLSPHDCRHYWTTAAIRGGSDIKSVQEGGGWKSPHMPLQYASRGAIANAGIHLAET